MTDRELLELAAMAAGYGLHWADKMDMCWLNEVWEGRHNNDEPWNPLRDGGDAFRLAIRLGMKLSTGLHHRFVMANDEHIFYDESKFGGACDPEGAMCRAIVQAAAEIGKGMK